MPDYNNTKIYKIYSPSNDDLVYFGHTTKKLLSSRLSGHLRSYRFWLKNKEKVRRITSYTIFDTCADYVIALIEKYPCNDVDEARARERYYIDNNKCLNKCTPGMTNQERCAKRYEEHKEEHLQKCKEYRANNKEKCQAYFKEYRAKNKETITCEICGMTFQKASLARHQQSQKHLQSSPN